MEEGKKVLGGILETKPIPLASEVKQMTIESETKNKDEFIRRIYNTFIKPKMQEGEFECVVSWYDEIPQYVVSGFEKLGYRVTYGVICYDQRDGYVEDKKKLNISWE